MPLAGQIVRASDLPGRGDFGDVATSETTASASYVNLATAGPDATVDLAAGQQCLVVVSCSMHTSGTGGAGRMSYAVSGAEVVAALDVDAAATNLAVASTDVMITRDSVFTAAAGGTYVFTAKYRTGSGVTGTFSNRRVVAVPLAV